MGFRGLGVWGLIGVWALGVSVGAELGSFSPLLLRREFCKGYYTYTGLTWFNKGVLMIRIWSTAVCVIVVGVSIEGALT